MKNSYIAMHDSKILGVFATLDDGLASVNDYIKRIYGPNNEIHRLEIDSERYVLQTGENSAVTLAPYKVYDRPMKLGNSFRCVPVPLERDKGTQKGKHTINNKYRTL